MATVATIADTTIVGDNEDQLVTMIVDNQLFGIPILQVQDIVEASKITPVPLAPSAIAGVLNLRGRIVTVVDLRKLLGNHEEVPWESQMGVTVEHKGDLYTLLVDAIGDVRTLPKRDFDKAPSTMEDNIRRLCSGIYRLRGNLLVVLDVARILHTDVIEATPMLTVEERRSRKNMAVTQSDGSEARSHQLSALMTDLNAYESETEGVFGAASDASDDDVKARKRANRDRRPVAERWQEVLEEKARKSGQVAFRMREPDEEIIENARTETAQEDAEWAARVMDADPALPGGTDDAPVPDALIDDAAPDLPPPAAPDPEHGLAPAGSGDVMASPEAAPDSPAEQQDIEAREPFILEAVPDLPMEESKIETPEPRKPDPAPDMPVEEQKFEAPEMQDPDPVPDMPVEEPKFDDPEMQDLDPMADMPVEEPKFEAPEMQDPDPVADMPVEEPKFEAPEMQDPDPAADMPVEESAASHSPEREVGGITSGWWNKLRGKAGEDTAEPETTEPLSGDESSGPETGDESLGKSKPAKKKTATKKKTAARKKTAAKPTAKSSAKSGSKRKASPKSKKKA
jgi:purine-binding chemotaxis protein CheW